MALCFLCDQNPRIDGDFVCKSSKEEHPFCYECGQRKRNYPFKYCTKCYLEQRQRAGGGGVTPTPAVSTGMIWDRKKNNCLSF